MAIKGGKSLPRKSMRVATIFTGVAAFVGPMAQVAHAQVTHPNDTMRPDSTHISTCGGAKSHWVHMGFLNGPVANSSCAGFAGRAGFRVVLQGYCGGNNSGYLYGSKPGVNISKHYGHGTTYALWGPGSNWGNLSAISIAKYSGPDKCPDFRTVWDQKYG
jgi:hypothetical protein